MDEIQTEVVIVFLLVIHRHLYTESTALLEISISSNSRNFSVKEKGGKPDRKLYPLPYGLRNPYRNLKSENSQEYAQKPQCDCTFMNSASGLRITPHIKEKNDWSLGTNIKSNLLIMSL